MEIYSLKHWTLAVSLVVAHAHIQLPIELYKNARVRYGEAMFQI